MAHDESQDKMYQARIAELEAENAHLRASAETFGELAERLNQQLREERRKAADRRTEDRASADRRIIRIQRQSPHRLDEHATAWGVGGGRHRGGES